MKLYNYGSFNEAKESNLTGKDYIHFICDKYNIKNYTINDDLTVDVDGDVYISNKALHKIPINFGEVNNFNCSYNLLTNLEGSPRIVNNFYCHGNDLTSLHGSPILVKGSFACFDNLLTSLEGISKEIKGSIICNDNQITDLSGVKNFKNILITGNPVCEILNLFPEDRLVEVIELLNEYDVIRGDEISHQGLGKVFWEIGIDGYKMI